MAFGLFPKIAAFTTIIPSAVLGGAMVAMFGMVIAYGIKMLSRIDFAKQENLLIVACSVGLYRCYRCAGYFQTASECLNAAYNEWHCGGQLYCSRLKYCI